VSEKSTDTNEQRKGIGFLGTIQSTFAAACGIQSKVNRERDFANAKPATFVIAGIVFVIVFILGMYGIVQLVLSVAAPS